MEEEEEEEAEAEAEHVEVKKRRRCMMHLTTHQAWTDESRAKGSTRYHCLLCTAWPYEPVAIRCLGLAQHTHR